MGELTRRQFLMLAGLAGGAAAAETSLGQLLKLFMEWAQKHPGEVIMNAAQWNATADMFLWQSEEGLTTRARDRALAESKILLKENPEWRPYLSIIQEGVEKYQAGGGDRVTYEFSPDRKPAEWYFETLKNLGAIDRLNEFFGDDPVGKMKDIVAGKADTAPLGMLESGFRHELGQQLPLETRTVMRLSAEDAHNGIELLVPGSGIAERAKKRLDAAGVSLPALDEHPHDFFGRPDLGEIIHKAGIAEELQHYYRVILSKSREAGERVSASALITEGLNVNNGSLSKALKDAAIVLKAMARNSLGENPVDALNFWGAETSRYAQIARRFGSLKDEFLPVFNTHRLYPAGTRIGTDEFDVDFGVFLDNPNKDVSIINLLGARYHLAWMVADLADFPAVWSKWMVVAQQLPHLQGAQGFLKTIADFRGARGQDECEAYFRRFPST